MLYVCTIHSNIPLTSLQDSLQIEVCTLIAQLILPAGYYLYWTTPHAGEVIKYFSTLYIKLTWTKRIIIRKWTA